MIPGRSKWSGQDDWEEHREAKYQDQSCPRVGWTRGSGRAGLGHDFAGFWRVFGGSGRVGSALRIYYFFTNYFLVPESIRIFEYYIRIDCFSSIFNLQ